MRDYREKDVNGFLFLSSPDGVPVPAPATVTVRMTSDEKGQTLSLNAGLIMIGIPLESVRDIVRVTKLKEVANNDQQRKI